MIAHYLKAPPFEYIRVIVEFQLVMVLSLAVLTMGLLVYRNWNGVRVKRLKAYYSDCLVMEMLGFLETGKIAPVVPHIPRYRFGKRAVLKRVFLDYFLSVSGPEKTFLAGRYNQFKFFKTDLRAMTSIFWWRRLRAVSSLSLAGADEYAPLFRAMTKDRNELVVASSCLALSSMKHEMNQPQILSELPKAVIQRKNVMYEILRNWSLIHGPDVLVEQIRQVRDPLILEILVIAVSALQSPEIASIYTGLLEKNCSIPVEKGLPADVIEKMLTLLRKVGDPASIETARKYCDHPQDIIRLRAYEYLDSVGDEQMLIPQTVLADRSIMVQRWFKARQERRAA